MSSEIMSLEMDVFCLLLLIRILYQMYINREQNDHWNYFYHTIAWACVYLFMDAIWIMNVKRFLTFSKIQSGIFNSFYFCSLAMLVCSWYVYAQKTLHSAVLKDKKILVLTFEAYQNWWERRHHFYMEKEWMMFVTGVVPAISSVVRKVTTVGENVLIMSPVYNIFYNSILNNGRHVLSSDLVFDGKEYHIDFEDLERKLALSQTTLMIFCNPHNPIGKIWDKETLQKIGDLCAKHHVTVLSDEIHCDITNPQKEYIPFASVSKTNLENTIMCIAPTKAFNMAGMQTACIVVANEVLRHKVNRGINTDEVAEPNSFAICATKAAFNQSEDWLNELNQYIQNNKDYAISFIQKEMNDVYIVPTEATYLLWIDCHKVCMDSVELTSFIREQTGLYVSDGLEYGENGKAFIRMNVACPFERLKDGLNRFKEGIYLYQNK
ncbi:MalY/PatB family protein [Faecalibacillus faecis]|uniref:MalY/PatB family protein n=2 Tax=Faecalibacillus faecis TaxID=1982628 RepID=UPI002F92A56E